MSEERRAHAPPWLFGITNIPFGVSGTFAGVSMPFLLRQANVDVKTIAEIGALALLPASIQMFYAPVLDLGIRRRAWLVLLALIGSICLGASVLATAPLHLTAFKLLLVLGAAFSGLVASCNGALISTTMPKELQVRAAGWVNAANLGAAVLGGGLVMTLATKVSLPAAAVGLMLLVFVPSLAALSIPEPEPMRETLLPHLSRMVVDVAKAVCSRTGWTGLLFCISPVGTVALLNLFSALGKDYGASSDTVEVLNGYAGGFVTAGGALAAGYLLGRVNSRHAYLASGILTALCATAMALGPKTPNAMIVGTVAYLLIAGLAYTAFSAVVYEIVGNAGTTAATLYSVFPAVGNQAIAYVMILDGHAHERGGINGLLKMDAGLNIAGVCFLLMLARVLRRYPTTPTPKDDTAA